MWEPVVCPLCGADDYAVRFRGRLAADDESVAFACTNIFWSDYRQVVRCRRCGMVYNNPCETEATLLANYREVVDPAYLREVPGRQRTFARALRTLARLAPPPAQLLDVGCYTGHFAAAARDAGYAVAGIEPSAWAAAYARNELQVTIPGETLAAAPAGDYDVVTMWDVIEHLHRPAATIAAIAARLAPGGLLALSTHNLASPAARLLGSRYPFLMRMHVAHFTPATLGRLLREHGLVPVRREVHWRWVRIGYALEKLAHYAPRLHRLLATGGAPLLRDRYLPIAGLGLMNVYARKTR